MSSEEILDDHAMLGSVGSADQLSSEAATAIQASLKWGKIYLYIGLGFLGLNLILSVGLGSYMSSFVGDELAGAQMAGNLVSSLIFYAILFYPAYMFWKFISKTPKGLAQEDTRTFVEGIGGLKSSIKSIAILFFAVIGLYLFVLVIILLAGAGSLLS